MQAGTCMRVHYHRYHKQVEKYRTLTLSLSQRSNLSKYGITWMSSCHTVTTRVHPSHNCQFHFCRIANDSPEQVQHCLGTLSFVSSFPIILSSISLLFFHPLITLANNAMEKIGLLSINIASAPAFSHPIRFRGGLSRKEWLPKKCVLVK